MTKSLVLRRLNGLSQASKIKLTYKKPEKKPKWLYNKARISMSLWMQRAKVRTGRIERSDRMSGRLKQVSI